MKVDFISAEELQQFKSELLQELKDMVKDCSSASHDDYLTADEVKKMLGISSKQFQLLRKRKQLTHYVVGRKIYVKRSDLDRFMEEYKIKSIY